MQTKDLIAAAAEATQHFSEDELEASAKANSIKVVQIVLCHLNGGIVTIQIKCGQNESDETNLTRFDPTALVGYARQRLIELIDAGFRLSNWHVVTLIDRSTTLPDGCVTSTTVWKRSNEYVS